MPHATMLRLVTSRRWSQSMLHTLQTTPPPHQPRQMPAPQQPPQAPQQPP